MGCQHRVANGMQHRHVFRVGIVAREAMVEFAIKRHHLAADRLQHPRRKRTGGTVAARRDHFQPAFELRPVGQIGDIAGRKIFHEPVGAARGEFELGAEHDLLEAGHFVRPESEGPVGAHLHSSPAIVVVRGRHHGDAWHVEVELREIRHRGDREPDVVDPASGRHQAGDQRIFDRGGVAAEIMAGDDFRLHPHLADQCAETQPQGLHAHEVDFLLEQPPGIVFPKTRGLHHRLGFVGVGVGRERSASGRGTWRPRSGTLRGERDIAYAAGFGK